MARCKDATIVIKKQIFDLGLVFPDPGLQFWRPWGTFGAHLAHKAPKEIQDLLFYLPGAPKRAQRPQDDAQCDAREPMYFFMRFFIGSGAIFS